MVKTPQEIDNFSLGDLKQLVYSLLEENARKDKLVWELREEINRLKGLKNKPDIKPPVKPSGMEKSSEKK